MTEFIKYQNKRFNIGRIDYLVKCGDVVNIKLSDHWEEIKFESYEQAHDFCHRFDCYVESQEIEVLKPEEYPA